MSKYLLILNTYAYAMKFVTWNVTSGQSRNQRGARGPAPFDKILAPLVGLGRYIKII